MMSSDKNKDYKDHQNSSSHSKAISTTRPPAALNCPRCDSPNTKFCYYNNYSLSQPRHFCKTCKRYWTKGGALRNVPVGGGCRKNKKTARASSSRPSSGDFKDSSGASSYSDTGGFGFFSGLQFQLGEGLTNIPRFNNISTTPPVGTQQLPSSFGDIPTLPLSSSAISNFGLDPNSGNNLSQFMPLNSFPISSSSSSSSVLKQDHADKFGGLREGLVHDTGLTNNNLAYSIESLSSINQDLHWKLQQDRFNTMFNGGDNNNYQRQNGFISSTANYLESQTQTQKPQPVLFQNLEISSKPADHDSRIEITTGDVSPANLATEWCFGNLSYAPVVNQNPTNSSGINIGNSKENQAWANFDQYTTLS